MNPYVEPPEDGSFIPTAFDEPNSDALNEMWEFYIIGPDNNLLVDPETKAILYCYDLKERNSIGLWRWKNLEVREEDYLCPDPYCDISHDDEVEFSLWAWAMGETGEVSWVRVDDEHGALSVYDAFLAGWYYFYQSLQKTEY